MKLQPVLRYAFYFLFLAQSHILSQSQTYTISGTILFQKHGTIYVSLCTQQEFNTMNKTNKSSLFEVSDSLVATGHILFSFDSIPAGTYAIRCYQDINMNQKLDFGLFGPTEPVCLYRPFKGKLRPPRFEDAAFTLPLSQDTLILDLRK